MSTCYYTDAAPAPALARADRRTRGDLWTRARRWLGALDQAAAELGRRRRLARLLNHDDRLLDDMGLTRDEIRQALRLPLTENAPRCLQARAAARRQQERALLRRRKPVTGTSCWK